MIVKLHETFFNTRWIRLQIQEWNCNEIESGEEGKLFSKLSHPPKKRMHPSFFFFFKNACILSWEIHASVQKRERWSISLLPLLCDVSKLLLDGVAIDVDEAEGLGGGGGESAPFGRVPTAGSAPHAVQAGSLDSLNGLLHGIQAVQKSAVRLRKRDVQQLFVVVFVLNNFEVGSGGSEENHCRRLEMALPAEEREERPKD